MIKKFELREKLSKKFIRGSGIEIGPTFLPVPLLPGVKVTYVDVMSKNDLISIYPDLKDKPIMEIDVIDDGEKLLKFMDNSVDFVIANHFIEHTVNPIKTLINFLRVLKENGIIFLAVPEMRATFDKDRPLTPVEHLIEVFETNKDPKLHQHYIECVRLIEKRSGNEVAIRVRELKKQKFSIHYHTFQLTTFKELIKYMRMKKYPVTIDYCEDLQPGTDEFILILRKSHKSTLPPLIERIIKKIFDIKF